MAEARMRPVVMVSVYSFLQRFDAVDWVMGRHPSMCQLSPCISLSEHVDEEGQGGTG